MLSSYMRVCACTTHAMYPSLGPVCPLKLKSLKGAPQYALELTFMCLFAPVDDGSGVLNCAQWRRSKDSADGLYVPDIGQLVSVFGQVEEYREEKQLRVAAVVPEADPNAEPCHWLEVEHARRTVYSQTFTLPDGVTEAHNGQQKKKRVGQRAYVCYRRSFQRPGDINIYPPCKCLAPSRPKIWALTLSLSLDECLFASLSQ